MDNEAIEKIKEFKSAFLLKWLLTIIVIVVGAFLSYTYYNLYDWHFSIAFLGGALTMFIVVLIQRSEFKMNKRRRKEFKAFLVCLAICLIGGLVAGAVGALFLGNVNDLILNS